MSKFKELASPASPYQPLRNNRPNKLDIHNNVSERGKNVWIKPKNNSVMVPDEVMELLIADIEKRHAGTVQAEEIVWYQDPRPFFEALKTSWATGLCLMLIIVSIFICVGIWFYVPSYLIGTALLPPLIAVGTCAFLSKRIRVDLFGCYALTKNRAIIVVPRRHLGFLKPIVHSFEFLTEKNLIMVHMTEARLQDQILTREPILADVAHGPTAVATVSFYPRTKYEIPFRFYNVQHSHAFELDFSDTMMHSPAPTNGGRLRIVKPDFEQQQAAARKFKIYPILGAVWFLIIIGTITALLWGVFYTQVKSHLTIAMVVMSWLFATTLSIASFYPVYSLSKAKREAIANARYVKYMIEK